jgi:hypothetical protein
VVNGRGGAGWLLAVAVRLLPPGRRQWGTAMRAELAGIARPGERWRFALGCVRVVATRPAVWRWAGNPLLVLGALVATLRFTARVGYAPLRWGLVGMIATLVVVACLGRMRPLGPVGDGLAARAVRSGGYLLVGVLAAEAVSSLARKDNHDLGGVPVLTVLFAVYLVGFLALSSRRSAAATGTLVTGAVAGGVAAAVWTTVVAVFPPIPPDPTLAVLLTVLGMAAAMQVARRRDGTEAALLAGVGAGTVGALVILQAVLVLSVVGPARLIPDLVPAALSPADDLANSRIELQDPYMWLLLFGWLIAIGQCVASLAIRRSHPAEADTALSWTRENRAVAATGTSGEPGPGRQ